MWTPITDLPDHWHEWSDDSLQSLADIWKEQRQRLQETNSFQSFMAKMRREIAIETGVIERLYTIDRGVTYMLIEKGVDAAYIPHGTTNKPATEVVAYIHDQEQAIEYVFEYVNNQRDLSTSFIKQLHQLLTRNQDYVEGIDQFGKRGAVELLKGDWKRLPNNPERPDGVVHEYCPPEHVASQMDMLLTWHQNHLKNGVTPEVEAAWLHHRFTQIHPFQDGNGRVARNLATLVFLRAGWFPLVVLNGDDENIARDKYLDALETADKGDLSDLCALFAYKQRQAFVQTLSLSRDALSEKATYQSLITALQHAVQQRTTLSTNMRQVENYALALWKNTVVHFQSIQNDLKTVLPQFEVRVDFAVHDDEERNRYYRYQIIEIAKEQQYYANLRGHKSWVRLSVRFQGIQTEWLIAFHGLGQEPQGVMVASAIAWQRMLNDQGEITPQSQSVQTLTPEPFTFTYQESSSALNQRFDKWLKSAIVLGMDYLRKSI